MARKHIAWGVVLACMIGILLARTPLTLEKEGGQVTPPAPLNTVAHAPATPRPSSDEPSLPRSEGPPPPSPAIPPEAAVPTTLEGLAKWALGHEEEMVACFEDAYREGRLTRNRAQVHMAAGPSRDGRTTLYLSVPDTAEHLHDVEACLNHLAGRANLKPAADGQETGVMWAVSLPVEQWE